VLSRDRRRSPRYPILQRCVVRQPQFGGADGWRSIAFDVSATGLGITLPLPLQPGAELEVRPWGLPGARPLRARVVHTRPLEYIWLCGCELADDLSDDELTAWRATARDRDTVGL
jgi:hypothetical protein